MGTTNSQKGLLTKSFVILLISFLCTGMIMKALGPSQKLDARFFYSYKDIVVYFRSLSPVMKKCYFFGELFDFWYLINYSLILMVLFRRFFARTWYVFIPGTFDAIENSLIIYNLKTNHLLGLHEILPFVSAIKWLSGLFLLVVLLIKFGLSFRKS